jgi:hypothetical protein
MKERLTAEELTSIKELYFMDGEDLGAFREVNGQVYTKHLIIEKLVHEIEALQLEIRGLR